MGSSPRTRIPFNKKSLLTAQFMDSRMEDCAPRIDPTSRRGRKLIDATFRAIA